MSGTGGRGAVAGQHPLRSASQSLVVEERDVCVHVLQHVTEADRMPRARMFDDTVVQELVERRHDEVLRRQPAAEFGLGCSLRCFDAVGEEVRVD